MLAKRLVLLLAACLATLSATAAFVEERSAFRQGMWWDPTRSGHGFEILANAGEDIMVVWYTYDTAGRPTWYTAQGTRGNVGASWSLLRHRWVGNRAESTMVGSMRLTIEHFEKITAAWQLDGGQGSWTLEPFVESGTINEVDLTGLWYDPSNSGWGMTLVDQGEVFGAVIYAYDDAGAPTWVAGFDRGKGTRVELQRSEGPCPACASRAVTRMPAGSIDLAYVGDTRVTVRGAPSIALAQGLRIDGARVAQLGRPASARRVDYQLANFAGGKLLKAYLDAGMENRIHASSGSDFSAGSPSSGAAVSFSTTNLQVEGVDEADVAKSDGRYLYALAPWSGHSTQPRKVRVAQIGAAGSSLRPAAEILLPIRSKNNSASGEVGLYLHGDQLVAVGSGTYYGGWGYTPAPAAETSIEVFSVKDPAAAVSRYHALLPGTVVSSRRIGDKLYVVTRFTPDLPGYMQHAYTDAQRSSNRSLLAVTPLEQLLPWIAENGGERRLQMGLASIYAPQFGGNRAVADMVVVSVFDLREPRLAESLAIVGRTEAMYVSNSAIYLASSRYDTRATSTSSQSLLPTQRSLLNTDIHKIAIEGSLRLVASGSIEGWVGYGDKAAFRFGEVGKSLGVVSSTSSGWWGTNSNRLTMLEPSSVAPGLLKTVSWLPNASRPQALGKPNEIVYGTRFVGDKLYAVTFRQVDPLYTVDLSNPADPRISGELEIPGFSDYLHPLPNGLLLGFGRDATPSGAMQGLHLSLYDVNGAAPRELQRVSIGKRGSDSALFRSHHALSVLRHSDGTHSVALPAMVNDGAPNPGTSGEWAWYPWEYSGLLRFEILGTTAADARLLHTHTLKTAVAAPGQTYPTTYAETSNWYSGGYGRSVLFRDATIYAGYHLWRMDGGGRVDGPY